MKKTHMYIVAVIGILVVAGFVYLFVGTDVFAPAPQSEVTEENQEVSGENGDSTAPLQGGQRIIENGTAVTIIYLTNLGFSPHEVTINAGEEVRFVNKTDGTMRVGTLANLSSTFYSSFVQPDAVGKDGTFQIGLGRQGLWSYGNLDRPESGVTGVVYIR